MPISPSSSAPRKTVLWDALLPGRKARLRAGRSLWVWWHLLSLDAPTVAVVWCWFFTAAFGLSLPRTALPTIALGTWSVYVADRLLDGWRSRNTGALRDRHWFYLRHRRAFAIAWCIVAVPLAYLIFFQTSYAVRADDVALCLIGVGYFLLIHGRQTKSSALHRISHCLTKELTVGFLFPVAAVIPTWTRLTSNRGELVVAAFCFGTVCWLNCVAIQTWEDAEASHEVMHMILSASPSQHTTASATNLTEFLGRHLCAFAIAVCAVSLALAAVLANNHAGSRSWPLFISVALSAVLFLVLIRNRQMFSALALRIAADAALLTPLLFLFRVR